VFATALSVNAQKRGLKFSELNFKPLFWAFTDKAVSNTAKDNNNLYE